MPRRFLFIFGQLVCLQHLVLGLSLERPECSASVLPRGGPGGFLLGLPPIWTSSLLLHAVAALLSSIHIHFDSRRCVEDSVVRYLRHVSDFRAQKQAHAATIEHESELQLQNWIEKLVLTLSDEEQAGRDFLLEATGNSYFKDAQVGMMPPEMRAFTAVVDSLLEVLSHCEKQLKSFSGSDYKWRKDMKSQILQHKTEIDCGMEHGMSEFLMESFMATDQAKVLGSHFKGDNESTTLDDSSTVHSSIDTRVHVHTHDPPGIHSGDAIDGTASHGTESDTLEHSTGGDPYGSSRDEGDQDDEMRSHSSLCTTIPGLRETHHISEWHFDALKLEAEHSHVLQVVGYEIIKNFGVVPRHCLREFLKALEEKYVITNSYHSHIHAADMCNAFFHLISKTHRHALGELADSVQVTMCIAALAHDVGHFGRNNNFLIQTRHALAVNYNDRSVLENHHASTLVSLLSNKFGSKHGAEDSRNYVMGSFSHDQEREARQLMVSLILATDTQMHLEDLAAFRLRLGASNFDPVTSATDRHQTLNMLFRASDIGHSAKVWELHEQWSRRVVNEFHAQGDEEKRLGLKVSPLCEREGFVMSSSQVGFLQFICLPTWKELLRWEEQQLRILEPELEPQATSSNGLAASQHWSPATSTNGQRSGTKGRRESKESSSKHLSPVSKSISCGAEGSGSVSMSEHIGSVQSLVASVGHIMERRLSHSRKLEEMALPTEPQPSLPQNKRHLAGVLKNCEANFQEWKRQSDEITQAAESSTLRQLFVVKGSTASGTVGTGNKRRASAGRTSSSGDTAKSTHIARSMSHPNMPKPVL